jgi:hypothetical protein
MAGGATLEVRTHPRNHVVGVRAGKLQLDVAIELLEAFLATELRPFGP